MEITDILHKMGLTTVSGSQEHVRLTVFYFNNPDGTIRWFWPEKSQYPHFLKFYNVLGWRSKLFSLLTLFVFKLRIQRLLFSRTSFHVQKSETSGISLLQNSQWAVFTGTPGPNRKAIVFTNESGTSSFIKIALGDHAVNLLRNECTTLDFLKNSQRMTFSFPKILNHSVQQIKLSDISGKGIRSEDFTLTHEQALLELRNETLIQVPLSSLPVWIETINRLEAIKKRADTRIPKGLMRKLDLIIARMNPEMIVDVCLSHGDFTPWNMYAEPNGSLHLYDWELAQQQVPFGFDAFHFVIQNAILVKRQSWSKIQQQVENTLFISSSLFKEFSSAQQKTYMELYLAINTIYYLNVYQEQTEWHTQVYWLINTWNEAVSSMLASVKSNRELVIMDLVDFLTTKKYAALKYNEELPEMLSEFSDMDFCIDKSDYSSVAVFLNQHVLIKGRQVLKKTFMASEQLMLRDGTMLSLDFIWKLKRKSLVMMEVNNVLENAMMLPTGIKVAAPIDNARYIGLFYALNSALVPAKYLRYQHEISQSDKLLDHMLTDYFQGQVRMQPVLRYVKSMRSNRGFSYLLNKIDSLSDMLKEYVHSDGMVITFSGVDGAGKSTVIENLKIQIEKKLRRRVVVIRHRPSLLPILSAWTKGKAAAEREAAVKLPRQGKNKNVLSSLLRFAYYYFDYVFGQWYITLKYVSRGYIVLYDRYYFDFINDSRRSNINLPSAITRLAYAFIHEPHYNFFLYADPELILSRKKELDKSTIEELTQKYLTLFKNLNDKKRIQRYVPVENIELATTLQLIMKKIVSPSI